jgi:hypothetical protein
LTGLENQNIFVEAIGCAAQKIREAIPEKSEDAFNIFGI